MASTPEEVSSGSLKELPFCDEQFLKFLGLQEQTRMAFPYYSLERAQRHTFAKAVMVYLYTNGASIINQGLVHEKFDTILPLLKRTQDARDSETVKLRYLGILNALPSISSNTGSRYDPTECNLVPLALIAKIAMDHMDKHQIAALYTTLTIDHNSMTMGAQNNFSLPNGSMVNEDFARQLLGFYIIANPEKFPEVPLTLGAMDMYVGCRLPEQFDLLKAALKSGEKSAVHDAKRERPVFDSVLPCFHESCSLENLFSDVPELKTKQDSDDDNELENPLFFKM